MSQTTQQFEKWLKVPVNLSNSNWEQWSVFVQTGLEAIEKAKYLTDNAPEKPEDEVKKWKIEDSTIRMILWNAMEPEILSMVHTFKSTKGMWDHLQATYSGKASMAHTYAVSQAYARCEQGDSSLTEYFASFKKLSDKMRELFPYCPDRTTYEKLWDQLDTLTFLGGISSKYSTARPILLGQTTAPILATTYHLLRDMFPSESSVPTQQVENSALVAGSFKGKDTRQPSGKEGKGYGGPSNHSNKNVQCHYCKEWGHMKWDCPKRPKGSPRPPPRAQVATTDQVPGGQTKSEEDATLIQRLEQLGFSRASMTSQPQTPRATLAHSGVGDEQVDWHCI
ncbi:Cysteine-rich RLK (RECEPTOR-like protein kinase) 8 [Rhynchospora pubera]|uniref:Cysteine-rich RLK (RECEPTOR-like protein kinase) 8 n=1 Tax=Rhynchospora pubera TaxID=906938 RepID=A0AAV8FFT0_9POAL|nr:Cysteine-rich RLK (RECEPTOR-like protein kinase) 8 [Rhynchospora pubera]